LKNLQQATLEIHLDAQEIVLSGDEPNHLIGTVCIKNIGNKTTNIEFPTEVPPLSISRINYNPSKKMVDFEALQYYHFSDEKRRVGFVTARVERELRFPFMVPVQKPGVYRILFQAEVLNEDAIRVDENKSEQKVVSDVWAEEIFVVVRGKKNKNEQQNITD
jgi:hypothetical protein